MTARALLLDRDGTLIRDVGYPRDPALVELLPDVAEALREARAMGFRLIIVSNQSGVGRGLITPHEASAVQTRVEEVFAAAGVIFDGAYFCFHIPEDRCPCRKPAPGMLLRAADELALELGAAIMIGDKPSDVDAGRDAGCATVAFAGVRHPQASFTCEAWSSLIGWLRAQQGKSDASSKKS